MGELYYWLSIVEVFLNAFVNRSSRVTWSLYV